MENSADLIITGSHGRKGLTRMLMGSVIERVIGFASCPVLVAHTL
jgi:nucleotide-binding universal stress UspA family protein